ncbi:hypothetical protein [Streptomyces sp. Tu102]|uniref:hypothetical protein n=1 Tax=Streptomyces TaxID=1883 RepID=UPI001BDD8E02|nr:hypothetical protein [Streptomyces sp. Tu102]MBT1093538.1 hypothetical protein [Streptomyces sp. Tu102]
MGGGGLTAAQQAYATGLRAVYDQWVGLSIREFARRDDVPHEYSSVSRFLSGDRLAPRSFIDCLMRFSAAGGGAEPEEAKEQLLRLRRAAALESTNAELHLEYAHEELAFAREQLRLAWARACEERESAAVNRHLRHELLADVSLLHTQVQQLRQDLDLEQKQRTAAEHERAELREETRRQHRQLRAASDYIRSSTSDHNAELQEAQNEFTSLETEVAQLRAELDQANTQLLRARAEGDQREAQLAELDAAAKGTTRPAGRRESRRLYYEESSSWRLQLGGAAVIVLSIGLGYLLIRYSLRNFHSTDIAMYFFVVALLMAGATAVAYGTASTRVLRVTGEGLILPDKPLHPWAEIGKVIRIAGYVRYSGRPCIKCGGTQCSRQMRGMVHPVLEVYSLDGTRLVRTGEPFMRAVNGDWGKFTDAVHAAAPQVVIEEQNPRAPEGGYVL